MLRAIAAGEPGDPTVVTEELPLYYVVHMRLYTHFDLQTNMVYCKDTCLRGTPPACAWDARWDGCLPGEAREAPGAFVHEHTGRCHGTIAGAAARGLHDSEQLLRF